MTTQIAEYSPTENALAELRKRFGSVLFDVSTSKGMGDAKEARAEIRGYRVSLEKKRVELKAPALERSRLIDAEAKRITAELEALENPIDDIIKADEKRKADDKAAKEREEIARLELERAALERIRNTPLTCVGKNAEQIRAAIDTLQSAPIDASLPPAVKEKAMQLASEALAQMYEMLSTQEQLEEQRAELDRRRADQAQREKDEAARKAEADREAQARADRERAEKDRAAEAERARLDEQARIERERQDAAAKAQRDEADRILAQRAKQQEEREAADKRAADEALKARLAKLKAKATLLGAAAAALELMRERGLGDTDVALSLGFAIEKETAKKGKQR